MEYDKEYHQEAHSYFKNNYYYFLRAKTAFRTFFSQIPNLRKKKVLEFGCGVGQNIFAIKDIASGYDIAKFSREFCKKKNIKIFDSESKIPNNNFDVILSSHVLEHIKEPLENLKLLRDKLKKQGVLILVLPIEDYRKEDYAPDLRNYHLYSWNFRSINNLLHEAGFEVINNKKNYGAGHHRLMALAKVSYPLYFFAIKMVGRLFNISEMVIVARKK
jgi:SAM-dependent methyltransferase